MDAGTGIAVLGTALGSAKLLEKILGPTSEYIGDSLCDFTKKRVQNIASIFNIAARNLDSDIESPGSVHPKILRQVVDEGSFCDDPIALEYFGGVLASSRTESGKDDRGASLMKQISRLTTYQLRSHYLFYSQIRKAYLGCHTGLQARNELPNLAISLPIRSFTSGLGLTASEDAFSITVHVLSGLSKEMLMGEPIEFWDEYTQALLLDNIVAVPTLSGIELFLWAHGCGHVKPTKWLREKILLPSFFDFDLDEPATAIPLH